MKRLGKMNESLHAFANGGLLNFSVCEINHGTFAGYTFYNKIFISYIYICVCVCGRGKGYASE